MKRRSLLKIIFIFLLPILMHNNSFSQQNSDTLNLAKKLRNENEYKSAVSLLNMYLRSHPDDVNTLWLLAQTQFWLGNFNTSNKLYEKALSIDPGNDYLNLDYAKTLTDMGEWKKSTYILDKLESKGKNYTDAGYIRSKILYWQCDFNKAKKLLDNVLWKDGNNKAADNLLTDVMIAKSPWIKFNTAYVNDNQPLISNLPSIETGKFFSPYANLFFGVYLPVFHFNGTVMNGLWLQAGNKSFFSDIRLLLQTNLGIVKYPVDSKLDWTANIYLQESFYNHLLIDATAEHKPYFNTVESIDTTLSVYHFASSFSWDDKNSFNGKAGIDYNSFPNSHNVYSFYGWVYAPPIKFSDAAINLGAAYSYSNSDYNTYRSKDSLSYIISNYTSYNNIPGIYDPYFTPKDQNIYSGLVSFIYKPVNILQLGVNANIGIYSYTQNPYLYLNNNSHMQVYIEKNYSKENFFPADIYCYANYQISDKMYLQFQYDYKKTYFYISNYFGINYRLSFWNDKKR